MKKDKLCPDKVDHKRKFGLRIFNIGGRIRKDKSDKENKQSQQMQ